MDGRDRLQSTGELPGGQQDGLYSRRIAPGREKGGIGPLAWQERECRLLDGRAHGSKGTWRGGYPDHCHRQPERIYRHHTQRVPRITHPDQRGAPDT